MVSKYLVVKWTTIKNNKIAEKSNYCNCFERKCSSIGTERQDLISDLLVVHPLPCLSCDGHGYLCVTKQGIFDYLHRNVFSRLNQIELIKTPTEHQVSSSKPYLNNLSSEFCVIPGDNTSLFTCIKFKVYLLILQKLTVYQNSIFHTSMDQVHGCKLSKSVFSLQSSCAVPGTTHQLMTFNKSA